MRIDVNLASQKFEDSRQFYVRWGSALALLVVITAGLILLSWYNFQGTASDRKRIGDLRQKIAKLDQDRKQAEEVLNRPENRDVRDQSRFWNDVIDQKSFSWTQLLSDLEKIMPARAYVRTVQPTLTQDKRLLLKLMIAGEKRDDVNDLVSKMERSERFHSSVLKSEELRNQGVAGGGPMQNVQPVWEFGIETFYTPATPGQQPRVSAKAGEQ
ncbi:MAG TPA: hypothetical protein VKE71_01455 [Candidatus Angelobacter sp.]|nr:hypothetical protein [Candidatus Angelobacter sp.]